jgi:hypothetical protein
VTDSAAAQPDDQPDDQAEVRSGDLITPTGPGHRRTTWYGCPYCDYQERSRSDGSLAEEFCPRDGALLVRVAPDAASG